MTEGLNTQQQIAVKTIAGPLIINAGPGTGKTKTLVARILHMIEQGISPDTIVALAFTNKAAAEMRARLDVAMPERVVRPTIATFHALARELLHWHDAKFITETQRLEVLRNVRTALPQSLAARDLSLAITKAKNALQPDPAIVPVLDAYNATLREKGWRDFDDLLLALRDALQADAAFRANTQQRCAYLMVDEFQDTNSLQYWLLSELCDTGNICVIGDPRQAIYGFRGASRTVFKTFEHDFPQAKKITLHVNYRSTPEIVALANVAYDSDMPLSAQRQDKGLVQAVETLNEYTEANWVVRHIQQAIGGGDFSTAISGDMRQAHCGLKDFAILYRSRASARACTKAIEASGLPYQVVGEGSPYQHTSVQRVIALLQRASGVPAGGLAVSGLTIGQIRALALRITAEMPTEAVVQAAQLLGVSDRPEVRSLQNTFVRFSTTPEALAHFEHMQDQHFYDETADAITLLTIHASKGLEFDHVFLLGANQGILPHENADLDEERRLFYVAITRARRRLDILHTQVRGAQPSQVSSFITGIPGSVLPRTMDTTMSADKKRAQLRKLKRSQQSLF